MNVITRNRRVVAAAVAAVTFVVILPALQNGFLNWDDNEYVTNNPFIRSLDLEFVKSAFGGFHALNWHPLTWFSHAIDYALWGLNPMGHHLTNNILHALNAAVVVLLVMKLMEAYRRTAERSGTAQRYVNDRTIMITGAVTGLLFGLHPLHVESFAWVSERKDLLCAFFFMLSLMSYTNYVDRIEAAPPGSFLSRLVGREYLVTTGLFALSLLSKPMAITLPFVLLILDWYLFRRIQSLKALWPAVIEKLPLFALSLGSAVLTILAQGEGGAIQPIEALPLSSRMIVAAHSLVDYLLKVALPVPLVPFYPYPERAAFLSPEYIAPIVIVAVVTAACLVFAKKQRLWISLWGYYVVTLLPVLGIVQVGIQAMADRYMYLPSLAPLFIIGFSAALGYERIGALSKGRKTLKIACLVSSLVIFGSLSYATVRQIGIWKDSISLWEYVIREEPGKVPIAHNNLGLAFASKGLYDLGIEQYQIALRLNPKIRRVHFNLGLAYFDLGAREMALREFRAELEIDPANDKVRRWLGFLDPAVH